MARHLSPLLSLYLARQFALWLGGVLGGLFALIVVIETVELVRRTAAHADIDFGMVLQMAALKSPATLQEAVPFAVLVAAMGCFWQTSRFNELVVTRAAGVSIWQILLPPLAVALAVAGLRVAAFDPAAATMLGAYERLEDRHIRGRDRIAAASQNGIWLREADAEGQAIIRAERFDETLRGLSRVTVLRFAADDRFLGRIDAPLARLEAGAWTLEDAWVVGAAGAGRTEPRVEIPTELTLEQIAQSFQPPNTISFWTLPRYIALIEETGFSALPHRLRLQRLLSSPLLLAAMVMIAASFAIRPPRRGGVIILIGAGGVAGFLLYFASYLVFKLGLTATIPLGLAAWTPAGVGAMLGIAALLHLEDG